MKKLFLVLMFLCCGFLYAESRTFNVACTYEIDFDEDINSSCSGKYISAILPYGDSFVVKFTDTARDANYGKDFEYYIYKGFVFYGVVTDYLAKREVIYKYTITDIKPNEFTAEQELLKKTSL